MMQKNIVCQAVFFRDKIQTHLWLHLLKLTVVGWLVCAGISYEQPFLEKWTTYTL